MQNQLTDPSVPATHTRALPRRWLPILPFLLGSIGFFPPPLRAAPPAEVYVFGDSGSEMGNLLALPEFAPGAHAPYWRGPDGFIRHASGPKWVELLFPGMRVSSDPKRTGERVNYAYDGAMTNEWIGGFPTSIPAGLLSQVAAFEAEVATGRLHPRGDSAIVIDIGPNDYFEGILQGTNPADTSRTAAANIATAIRRVASVARSKPGATGQPLAVFVNDLPDFSAAPLFLALYKSLPPEYAELNRRYLADAADHGRTTIDAGLRALGRELGDSVNLVTLPGNTLFTAIRENPSAFGFTNITDPVYDDETDTLLVTDTAAAEKHLFVDWLHLTAKGERLMADYFGQVVDSIQGRPQQRLARLADSGLASAEIFSSQLLDAPRTTSARHWSGIVDISNGYRRATLPGDEGHWETFPTNVTVGFEHAPSSDQAWGLGATLASARTWVDDKALRADLAGGGLGLFARRDLGWATLRSSVTWTRLAGKVRRDPRIPTMKAEGRTHDTIWAGDTALVRTIAVRDWTAEFEVGARLAEAEISAYSEHGAPGLDLRFEKFTRESAQLRVAASLRPATWQLGAVSLQPGLRVSAAYEVGDAHTAVQARLLGNTAAPTFGYADHGRRWRLGAAPELVLGLPRELTLALRGRFETDTADRHETGVTIELSRRF